MYFDFNEINIISQNMTNDDKHLFLKTLNKLKETTNDKMLYTSVDSLINKIMNCSRQQVKQLYNDMKKGNLSASDGYVIAPKR